MIFVFCVASRGLFDIKRRVGAQEGKSLKSKRFENSIQHNLWSRNALPFFSLPHRFVFFILFLLFCFFLFLPKTIGPARGSLHSQRPSCSWRSLIVFLFFVFFEFSLDWRVPDAHTHTREGDEEEGKFFFFSLRFFFIGIDLRREEEGARELIKKKQKPSSR